HRLLAGAAVRSAPAARRCPEGRQPLFLSNDAQPLRPIPGLPALSLGVDPQRERHFRHPRRQDPRLLRRRRHLGAEARHGSAAHHRRRCALHVGGCTVAQPSAPAKDRGFADASLGRYRSSFSAIAAELHRTGACPAAPCMILTWSWSVGCYGSTLSYNTSMPGAPSRISPITLADAWPASRIFPRRAFAPSGAQATRSPPEV